MTPLPTTLLQIPGQISALWALQKLFIRTPEMPQEPLRTITSGIQIVAWCFVGGSKVNFVRRRSVNEAIITDFEPQSCTHENTLQVVRTSPQKRIQESRAGEIDYMLRCGKDAEVAVSIGVSWSAGLPEYVWKCAVWNPVSAGIANQQVDGEFTEEWYRWLSFQ